MKGCVIMAHVAKYTSVQVGHLFNHYNRDKEKDCNRSNEDIDKERTKDNYNLMQREETPQEYYKERLDELYNIGRADVKTMCDWVVTLPKDYQGDAREFFVHTVDFLNERYGANNCIGAFVHMDEKTPHLHYSFIPVSRDDNPNHEQQEKVCAKEVLTRSDLRTFHDDLQNHLRERLPDREINITTGITKEQGRNMTVQEIKLNAKAERLKEKEKEIEEREERLTQKEERLKEQKRENLERQKELDKQQRELKQKQVDVASREKDVENREHKLDRLEERNKEVDKYFQYRDSYCERNGITQQMYDKECLMSKYTGQLKPYPEIANPTLPREEREELAQAYKEQQHEHEHTHTHEREMERER